MIRLLYSTLFALVLPFVLLKLYWRGFKAPEYRERRFERFGFFKAPNLQNTIWFHTVSVGELLAAEPIIKQVQARFPERQVVITTMTPTSSALVKKLFADSVFHVYAPYDLPVCVKAFLRRIRPSLLVIMETELWPNMIHHTSQLGCAVVVANARLSERSARGYRRLRPAIGWMLDGLSYVLCQYENDASRFASLGIETGKIAVTGSVKYDIAVPEGNAEFARQLRCELTSERLIWIAASTHEGEDQLALEAHAALREHCPDAILVLVPRHPERFESAYELAIASGFETFRRTENQFIPAETEVFVVDTMGEMMAFYKAADLAVVGGSFVEIGGHNPIEPAVLAKPVLMGPYYFNFEAICLQLQAAGGLGLLAGAGELSDQLIRLMQDHSARVEMGQQAERVVKSGRGAVSRVVTQLIPLVEASTAKA